MFFRVNNTRFYINDDEITWFYLILPCAILRTLHYKWCNFFPNSEVVMLKNGWGIYFGRELHCYCSLHLYCFWKYSCYSGYPKRQETAEQSKHVLFAKSRLFGFLFRYFHFFGYNYSLERSYNCVLWIFLQRTCFNLYFSCPSGGEIFCDPETPRTHDKSKKMSTC